MNDGEAIWFMGTLMTIKAAREETNGAFTLIEVHHPPGFATPLHIHRAEDEWFYILEGAYTYYRGDEIIHAIPGAFVALPRDVPHAFQVDSKDGGRVLQLTSPSGLEGFFREGGRPAAERTLPPPTAFDLAKVRSLEAKYRNEHVGPPPGKMTP